jgi:hypothetical protein
LDQTAGRFRVSLHGRTLVEMAIVRICHLDDLDELADLVAELRGTAPAKPPAAAKKNVEPRPAGGSTAPAVASEAPPPSATNGESTSEESVLKRYQMAMEAAASGPAEPTPAPAPRVSRRQQVAEVGERPFVQKAMELFEVAPGQFRFSPPESDSN